MHIKFLNKIESKISICLATGDCARSDYDVYREIKTVITSLHAKKCSAEAIAELYQEWWEIEACFSLMEQSAVTLRSTR